MTDAEQDTSICTKHEIEFRIHDTITPPTATQRNRHTHTAFKIGDYESYERICAGMPPESKNFP